MIEEILGRIATALERIANIAEHPVIAANGTSTEAPKETKKREAAKPAAATQVAPTPLPAVDVVKKAEAPTDNPFGPAPAASAASAVVPSRDDIGKLVVTLAKTAGREATVEMLKGFGAVKVEQVVKDDYPLLFEKLNAAIEAAQAAKQ